MRNKIFKSTGVVFILVTFIFIGYLQADSIPAVSVSLVYPQKSNAPKREMKKKDKPAVVKDVVLISAEGLEPGQLKSANLYIEYFLDDVLVYSTKDNKECNLGFVLDTVKYVDGQHKLVLNLWDKDGSSAIGMRELVIQNGKQTK